MPIDATNIQKYTRKRNDRKTEYLHQQIQHCLSDKQLIFSKYPVFCFTFINLSASKSAKSDLMIVAFTVGGFMWTLSLPPTSRRTVAVKRESFFNTCGGCFSIMNVLHHQNHTYMCISYNNYFRQLSLANVFSTISHALITVRYFHQ